MFKDFFDKKLSPAALLYLVTKPGAALEGLVNSNKSISEALHPEEVVNSYDYNPWARQDSAMFVNAPGGIDLNTNKMNLQTQNQGGEINLQIDPAMLAQYQNASGFVPVIINIQPMTDLRLFLGLLDTNQPKVSEV